MTDSAWMQQALALADQAAAAGEVPVGAVVVRNGSLLGEGWNAPIGRHDPTAHAEIMALRAAAEQAGNYRLPGATLYVTLEPCTMCVGAMVHARIDRLVIGALEPKAGAVMSRLQLLDSGIYNTSIEVTAGVLADACSAQLSGFFQRRRAEHKQAKLP